MLTMRDGRNDSSPGALAEPTGEAKSVPDDLAQAAPGHVAPLFAAELSDATLGVLTHELMSPLNAILGWAVLLRRQGRAAELVAHGLEVIERNARRQIHVTSDLLDALRIASGRMEIVLQAVALSDVITAAIDAFSDLAEAKGIPLTEVAPCVETVVQGDPARLQQALMNVLSNAIKFTPRGGRVDVRVLLRGSVVEIVVQDTGIGIAGEVLPHVFDAFQQAETSTVRAHGGLGLGLTIAKHLVELHGGTLRAESAGEMKGAVFTIALPCAAPL
jgi:signal transduction histidine kinase